MSQRPCYFKGFWLACYREVSQKNVDVHQNSRNRNIYCLIFFMTLGIHVQDYAIHWQPRHPLTIIEVYTQQPMKCGNNQSKPQCNPLENIKLGHSLQPNGVHWKSTENQSKIDWNLWMLYYFIYWKPQNTSYFPKNWSNFAHLEKRFCKSKNSEHSSKCFETEVGKEIRRS